MIKALIFDWFGVCAERWLDVLRRELKGLVDPSLFKKSYLRHLDEYVSSKITGKQFHERVFTETGIDPHGQEHLLTKLGKVNTKLMEIILELRETYKTVLLSDNLDEQVPLIEKMIGGFEKYFDEVILSNVLKMLKKDGEMFKIALDRIKERPEDCVFIDDRERNTEVAIKMGFNAILFRDNEQMISELSDLGVDVKT